MREYNAIKNAMNFGKGKKMNELEKIRLEKTVEIENEITAQHDGEYHTIRITNTATGEMVAAIIVGPNNTHVMTNWFAAGEFTVENVTNENE